MRYSIIFHELRVKWDLTITEYCILNSIDVLSHNRKYDGWCVQSKHNIADSIGVSRRSVQRAITKLEALGLVERSESGLDVRTSDLFIQEHQRVKQEISTSEKKSALPSPIPTLHEVKQYFADNGYMEEVADTAYRHYNSLTPDGASFWLNSKGKPVRNWKNTMNTVWFTEKNKKKVNYEFGNVI